MTTRINIIAQELLLNRAITLLKLTLGDPNGLSVPQATNLEQAVSLLEASKQLVKGDES